MKDILLVEDNKELAQLILYFLKKGGMTVCHAASGEDAMKYLEKDAVKVVLLDIMLPGMDGFAVCREIRRKGNIPILIMSAKSEKTDKLTGYELGADDYMVKPIDPEILTAKAKALMTRSYGAPSLPDILISGQLTIDKNARKVYLKEEPLELNVKEYELLVVLAQNAGKTLHKEYLFNEIWGTDSFSENQTLTVHIKMLRTKIEKDPRQPKRIQTVWGVGYRYEEV